MPWPLTTERTESAGGAVRTQPTLSVVGDDATVQDSEGSIPDPRDTPRSQTGKGPGPETMNN